MFEKTGIHLLPCWPLFGASPDGMNKDFVVEIKCPISHETMKNYIAENGSLGSKYMAQIQLQMLMTGRNQGLFCVAHPDFETSGKVTIKMVKYDDAFLTNLMMKAQIFWKDFIFPVLIK